MLVKREEELPILKIVARSLRIDASIIAISATLVFAIADRPAHADGGIPIVLTSTQLDQISGSFDLRSGALYDSLLNLSYDQVNDTEYLIRFPAMVVKGEYDKTKDTLTVKASDGKVVFTGSLVNGKAYDNNGNEKIRTSQTTTLTTPAGGIFGSTPSMSGIHGPDPYASDIYGSNIYGNSIYHSSIY